MMREGNASREASQRSREMSSWFQWAIPRGSVFPKLSCRSTDGAIPSYWKNWRRGFFSTVRRRPSYPGRRPTAPWSPRGRIGVISTSPLPMAWTSGHLSQAIRRPLGRPQSHGGWRDPQGPAGRGCQPRRDESVPGHRGGLSSHHGTAPQVAKPFTGSVCGERSGNCRRPDTCDQQAAYWDAAGPVVCRGSSATSADHNGDVWGIGG